MPIINSDISSQTKPINDKQLDTLKIGFLRMPHIIGDPNANPPIPPIIPVSRSTWWNWVKSGKAPAPVKLGPKTTAWKAEDIRRLLDDLANGVAA